MSISAMFTFTDSILLHLVLSSFLSFGFQLPFLKIKININIYVYINVCKFY